MFIPVLTTWVLQDSETVRTVKRLILFYFSFPQRTVKRLVLFQFPMGNSEEVGSVYFSSPWWTMKRTRSNVQPRTNRQISQTSAAWIFSEQKWKYHYWPVRTTSQSVKRLIVRHFVLFWETRWSVSRVRRCHLELNCVSLHGTMTLVLLTRDTQTHVRPCLFRLWNKNGWYGYFNGHCTLVLKRNV